MIYVDFEELIAIFQQYYPGLGLVLDNDVRCIPGIVFFADSDSTEKVAQCFLHYASSGKNDMQVLAKYYQEKKEANVADTLPIIMPAYIEYFGLSSRAGHKTTDPARYCNHIEDFKSIFDGAALGQYLGGIDPRNGHSKPGFINESCLFNPSKLKIVWERDTEGRKVPFAIFNEAYYRINNLHIHLKKLNQFSS